MSDIPFANFLQTTGHRVLHGAGVPWYEASRGFFLSLPSHRKLALDSDDEQQLFAQWPCLGLRFPAAVEGPGKLSYQIVCDDPDYGLAGLSANIRSKVRRGLKRCEVGPVGFAEIATEGRVADRDTLARQGRGERLDDRQWDAYWRAAAATAGMEGWAARVDGQMAAFLISVDFGDGYVEFLLARSRSDCLNAYPNNALIFHIAEEMLRRRGMRCITFGLESLEPVGALDEFKYGMGFRRDPLRQRVLFHPLLRPLLRRHGVRDLLYRFGGERGPEGGFWRKATGLLRFADEGGELSPAVG